MQMNLKFFYLPFLSVYHQSTSEVLLKLVLFASFSWVTTTATNAASAVTLYYSPWNNFYSPPSTSSPIVCPFACPHTHTTYCDEWKNGVSFRSGSTVREALLALGILQMIFQVLSCRHKAEESRSARQAFIRWHNHCFSNILVQIKCWRLLWQGGNIQVIHMSECVCVCVYMDVYAASSYYLVYV